MFDDTSPFDLSHSDPEPAHQRTRGSAKCVFKLRNGKTVLDELHQSGSFKVRLPKSPVGEAPEAVLLNTSGGLTGGDQLDFEGVVAEHCDAVFTTQASERAYRSLGNDAAVSTRLSLSKQSRLAWLPQETIMFDDARLARTFNVDMEPCSRLLAHESIVFGRTAMKETVQAGSFRDTWKIYQDGKLVHADAMRLDGDIDQTLSRAAVLKGAKSMATIVYIGADGESHIDPVRASIDATSPENGQGGVSAWGGKLVCRVIAVDGAALRRMVMPILKILNDGRALPRVWNI